MSISNNYKQILDSIKKIEKNANRSSGSVKLLVVQFILLKK